MPQRGQHEPASRSSSLHRVTPIPDQFPLTGRISGTPSVGSIPEDIGEELMASFSETKASFTAPVPLSRKAAEISSYMVLLRMKK